MPPKRRLRKTTKLLLLTCLFLEDMLCWTTLIKYKKTEQEIVKELQKLCDDREIVTLCLKGQKNRGITLKAIEEKRNYYLLVFQKHDDLEIAKEPCLFFYRPAEYLTRGFQGKPLKDIGKLFSMVAPSEIFEIGMRKFPRVSTPNSSRATFCQRGKTRIFPCNVIDISLEGAMVCMVLWYC